jgi:hypothetical protein
MPMLRSASLIGNVCQTLLTGGILEDKERSKERREGPADEHVAESCKPL